jgi:hypothetical protein
VPRELSGPVRPGTGGEGGREKSRAAECRSKVPYLPYQISTSMSHADSPKARTARRSSVGIGCQLLGQTGLVGRRRKGRCPAVPCQLFDGERGEGDAGRELDHTRREAPSTLYDLR